MDFGTGVAQTRAPVAAFTANTTSPLWLKEYVAAYTRVGDTDGGDSAGDAMTIAPGPTAEYFHLSAPDAPSRQYRYES